VSEKKQSPTSEIIQVFCRLRWLRLEEPKAFQPGQAPRWEATGILDPSDAKGKEGIKTLLTAAAQLSKAEYGVVPLAIKKLGVKFLGNKALDLNDPANADDGIKTPFTDGDDKKWEKYDGYKGMFIVAAHNSKKKPGIADPFGKKITGELKNPYYPYDGCYGYLSTTLWLLVGNSAKTYGNRVGINLRGVQFVAKGEPFTSSEIDAEDEFDALEDAALPGPAAVSDFD
jgi:hypothetical protein